MIDPTLIRRLLRPLVLALSLLVLLASTATAQQPFVTDDSDTTPKGHFHFGFADEFDLLPHTDFPSIRQNEADVEFEYGLLNRVEIGIEVPLLTIFKAPDTIPKTTSGVGDTNLSLKCNFLKHPEKSRVPALALVFNLELPTGDTNRELGSGLADFYVNGILQSSITKKTRFRLNGGILFSGNQTTGVEGIKTRGTVFTGGGSFVRQFHPKLQLGIELTGAVEKNFDLGKGQLQTMVGGNYQFRKNASFDFGVVAGKFTASPRFGAKLGISIDW
jgi:Putative MetA-pathway of phenol degradation